MRISARNLTALILATCGALFAALAVSSGAGPGTPNTAIHHVVVIFDENESFDHYFGTYPNAANLPGENTFTPVGVAPASNNYVAHPNLLATGPGNNPNTAAPQRIPPSAKVTCDQKHGYNDEQKAINGGLMDKFVEFTQGGGCSSPSLVMDYYDGNTVTALWNLAQRFSMSDNFFGSTFGPSTPGALNLISGNTSGSTPAGGVINGTMIGDPDPAGDDCGGGGATVAGPNIGDLMNAAGMTWGWFQGGFKPTSVDGTGKATCGSTHTNAVGGASGDYSPHHQPFQYYASTRNPHHLPPTSVAAIGTTDQANHQYDLTDFDAMVKAGTLPAVSFLKAAQFEDAHPGNSGPTDEQRWIARVLDEIQQSSHWPSTLVIIAYDDSDGWYDHVAAPITNHSQDAADDTICNGAPAGLNGANSRCGPGPRLPLLLVSSWAKQNYIDHTQTDQSSIIKYIEDNWNLPRIGGGSFDAGAGDITNMLDLTPANQHLAPVYLDPNNGQVIGSPPANVASAPPTTATSPPPPAPPTTTASTTNLTPPPTTTTTTTKPKPKPTPFKPKLSFSTKKTSKSLKLSFRVTGLSASKGKITVSVKLTLGKKTIASGKGTVHSGRVTLTLKSKKKLKRGTYKLSMTVSQAGKSAKFSKTLKLH